MLDGSARRPFPLTARLSIVALVCGLSVFAVVVPHARAAPTVNGRRGLRAARAAVSPPPSNGGSRITGVPSGRCLDVTGGATAPGTRLQLWNCLGDPQQAWVYSSGRLEVYAGGDALCLDADDNYGGASGTPIQVWTCTGKPNQQWTAGADGTLRSVAYGLCLDAVGGGTANGTKLQLWQCNGDAQQDWVGPPVPNGGGPVRNLGSGRCLDVTNASISPGTRPQLWNCLGDAQQQWLQNGRELQAYADKCLDATDGGTTPGTPVQIWYCLQDPQQQWSWGADGTIRQLPSGLCLEPVNQDTTNGTQLVLWTCTGSAEQTWSRAAAAPAPPPPPSTSTVPVTTPIPRPTVRHALKVRLVLSWTWRRGTTWLHRATIGTFPGRTRLTIHCRGAGCGRHRTASARGHRSVRRLLRSLAGRRYRTGDVLAISLTAPGYVSERADVTIRGGREPRVRALR